MRLLEELKKEAQQEVDAEQEDRVKNKIKEILYNIAEVQKGIENYKARLVRYQKTLAEFKVEDV